MPNFRLNKMGGGLTDDYIDPSDPSAFKRLSNVYLDQNDKITQREGFDSYATARVSGGNTPVSKMAVIDEVPLDGNLNPTVSTLFYHFQQAIGVEQIHSATPDSTTLDYQGNPARVIVQDQLYDNGISGIRTGKAPDDNKSVANSRKSKFYAAKTDRGVVLTFDSYSDPAIWSNDNSVVATDAYSSLGLPNASATTFHGGGSGSDTISYVWYYHYYYLYTIGTATFIVNGPVETIQRVNSEPLGTNPGFNFMQFTFATFASQAVAQEPGTEARVALYRTTGNGTQSHYVTTADVSGGAPVVYTDTATDSAIVNNVPPTGVPASVYISGGVLDDEAPLAGKFCVEANEVLWIGNVEDLPQRVIYGKPKQPHAFPGSFFIDMPDTVTGMSFSDIYPIVFTSSAVYRLEGISTSAGLGQPVRRLITDKMGTHAPHAIVKAEDKIYWLGSDGIYATNGYKYAKVTETFDDSLRKILQPSLDAGNSLSALVGTYNKVQKRIYWAVQKSRDPDGEVVTVGFDNDIVLALDLKSQNPRLYNYYEFPEQDAALVGGYASRDAGYYPTSVVAFDDMLLVGDKRGFILKHERHLTTDVIIETSTPFINAVGTVYDFITPAYALTGEFSRAWVPSMIVSCKNFYNASKNLTLQLLSINDDNTQNTKKMKAIEESGAQRAIHKVRRKFPSGAIRAFLKQIWFRRGLKKILSSDTLGLLSLNGATAQLAAGTWGAETAAGFLYTSADDFAAGNAIKTAAPASDTAILYVTTGIVQSDLSWYILEYPKDEKFRLEAFEVEYQSLGESVTEYSGS